MRIMLWTHNSFAVGHVYRTCAIARALRAAGGDDILVVSGARFRFDHLLPSSVEVVKIPSFAGFIEDGGFQYQPAALPGFTNADVSRLRAELLACTFREFNPDVFLVDHQPAGLNGELLGLIDSIQIRRVRKTWSGYLLLGTRGIIDEASAGKEYLTRHKGLYLMETAYDGVLVYADPQIVRFGVEYGLPEGIRSRVTYTGYVDPDAFLPNAEARAPHAAGFALLAAGGGRDGFPVLERGIQLVRAIKQQYGDRLSIVLVTGPYMPIAQSEQLRAVAHELLGDDVSFYRFNENMSYLMRSARVFIGMGGYNTLVQLIKARTPALILPREEPESEQLHHATRLSNHANFLTVKSLQTPLAELAQSLHHLLLNPSPSKDSVTLDLSGAECTAKYIRDLL